MRARALAGAAVAALITLVTAEAALQLASFIPFPSTSYIPDDETGFKLRPSAITDVDGFNDPHTEADPAPARRVGEALAARGIPFVDLTPALAAAGPVRVYNRGDTHWNRRGNAIAAATIADALKPLLPPP